MSIKKTIVIASLALLAACGGDSSDRFVGEWLEVGKSDGAYLVITANETAGKVDTYLEHGWLETSDTYNIEGTNLVDAGEVVYRLKGENLVTSGGSLELERMKEGQVRVKPPKTNIFGFPVKE